MLQNWALGSFGGQTLNPSILSSAPQAVQLLQSVPQQLQQLQQQLQQIQQLVHYAAYQLQALAQHQPPQLPLGLFGSQSLGQPFGTIGAGLQPFQPSPHVM